MTDATVHHPARITVREQTCEDGTSVTDVVVTCRCGRQMHRCSRAGNVGDVVDDAMTRHEQAGLLGLAVHLLVPA